MTDLLEEARDGGDNVALGSRTRPSMGRRIMRGTGWTLISFGAVVLLYLFYLLVFTNLETGRAQASLLNQWELEFGDPNAALPGEDLGAGAGDTQPVEPGDAYAAMWFERDGQRIVHEDTLFVVEGVTLNHLRRGPGHFPDSPAPGSPGNVAISGHRTTYGAPFYNLNELEPGDEVHVVDRSLHEWVYEVAETRVVSPLDVWVVHDQDPRNVDLPTLTLTTCNPRFSAAQRLIVWAHLVEADADTADTEVAA